MSPSGDGKRIQVTVGERRLTLSNLDKILYPEVGFTKAQVIDYYARVAPYMLPHVAGRCMTVRRWPEGVDQPSFFEKNCPKHRPDWMQTVPGAGHAKAPVNYCRFDEEAALVWAANMASLEIHAPMACSADLDTPTMVVFDLDPGAPAGIKECCQVGLELREVLHAVGLDSYPKTSGSKGLQVYVPLNDVDHPADDGQAKPTHKRAAQFALVVGQLLLRQVPNLVVVEMAKKVRAGKVFVDWSQNSSHKTTIAPYSLRGLAEPRVSTPVSWDEISGGAEGQALVFGPSEVLSRVESLGDIFGPTCSQVQRLPFSGQ